MKTIPEILIAQAGVVAVAVAYPHPDVTTHQGAAGWETALNDALSLLGHTDETDIKVTIGGHTIVAQRLYEKGSHDTRGCALVAVAVKTGDPIMKSIHRTLRRVGATLTGESRVVAPDERDDADLDFPIPHPDGVSF